MNNILVKECIDEIEYLLQREYGLFGFTNEETLKDKFIFYADVEGGIYIRRVPKDAEIKDEDESAGTITEILTVYPSKDSEDIDKVANEILLLAEDYEELKEFFPCPYIRDYKEFNYQGYLNIMRQSYEGIIDTHIHSARKNLNEVLIP